MIENLMTSEEFDSSIKNNKDLSSSPKPKTTKKPSNTKPNN